MDSKVCFYREWLNLPKQSFGILAMLAEQGGSFKGSLADMCRQLNIKPGQSKTNAKLKSSIEALTADGYIYNTNGFDIALVQRLLQHSSAATTQRYIGIEPQRIEQAIQNHAQLL